MAHAHEEKGRTPPSEYVDVGLLFLVVLTLLLVVLLFLFVIHTPGTSHHRAGANINGRRDEVGNTVASGGSANMEGVGSDCDTPTRGGGVSEAVRAANGFNCEPRGG